MAPIIIEHNRQLGLTRNGICHLLLDSNETTLTRAFVIAFPTGRKWRRELSHWRKPGKQAPDDAAYHEALELFVAEEQAHARFARSAGSVLLWGRHHQSDIGRMPFFGLRAERWV